MILFYLFTLFLLILEIDFLDATADTGQYLIGNRVKDIGENGDRQVLTKDFHTIALMARYVGNINHGNVHADIAYVWCFLSVYQTVAGAASQMAV